MRNFFWSIWEFAETVFIAFLTVFLIRSFLIQPFLVSGASMEPVFYHGDYLLVDELTYRFRPPERGEVIVFQPPISESYFIKRIIGLPGDRVEIKNGEVKILKDDRSFVLKEDYLPPGIETFGDLNFTVKKDEYLVFGDNRNYSFDSRSWGPLKKDKIIGLVRLRLWPFNKVMAFETPAY